jgi:hypothetical protein
MKPIGRAVAGKLASLLGIVYTVMVVPAWAQAPTTVPAPAPVGSDGAAGGTVVALVILGLLVAIGVTVKLVDMKRKHEDEAAALQARITDALMIDRSLSGLALTPVVDVPFRRGGLVTVNISGAVPAPELREAALQVVMRAMEQSRTSCRIEDHILVDPLMSSRAA